MHTVIYYLVRFHFFSSSSLLTIDEIPRLMLCVWFVSEHKKWYQKNASILCSFCTLILYLMDYT